MMEKSRTIWHHEVEQFDRISRSLLADQQVKLSRRILILPLFFYEHVRFRRRLHLTRKNLLYTKRLAFKAAREISKGKDRAWEIRSIEIETKALLDKEKKGYYNPKVRRKQLFEIELLIDYYLGLLQSTSSSYGGMLREVYPSKKIYESFLDKLQEAEQEVIQAAISTVRKGSKKDRYQWFKKVTETTVKTRMKEMDHFFPEK